MVLRRMLFLLIGSILATELWYDILGNAGEHQLLRVTSTSPSATSTNIIQQRLLTTTPTCTVTKEEWNTVQVPYLTTSAAPTTVGFEEYFALFGEAALYMDPDDNKPGSNDNIAHRIPEPPLPGSGIAGQQQEPQKPPLPLLIDFPELRIPFGQTATQSPSAVNLVPTPTVPRIQPDLAFNNGGAINGSLQTLVLS